MATEKFRGAAGKKDDKVKRPQQTKFGRKYDRPANPNVPGKAF